MNPPPSPITEAAGLLESGAIFPRRVGLRRAADSDPAARAGILAGWKQGGFSLYFGDAPIFHFDSEGRWQRAFLGGSHHLKGLDSAVRVVDRVREAGQMVLRRWTLDVGSAEELDDLIASEARDLGAEIAAGDYVLMPPPAPSRMIEPEELAATLGRIAGWDASAWSGHRAAYRRAYGDVPPPFLPPDCPHPVILQPTGAMSPRDVLDHARGVAALLGRRIGQCRNVFLADPGWLDRSPAEVVALLGAINDVFPIHPDPGRPRAADTPAAPRLAAIHAWLDAPPAARLAPAAWARFRAAHLGRITWRVDLRSSDHDEAIRATIADLKAAGIGVGLALLLDPTVRDDRAAFLATLPLAAGDLIALIARDQAADDPSFLTSWKGRITAALPPQARGPRVVVYNPDKQWI